MHEVRKELTRIVIRVRDERCTTRSSEITMLTAMPTSTFQMMVKKNVSAMSERSTHARILEHSSVKLRSSVFAMEIRTSRRT